MADELATVACDASSPGGVEAEYVTPGGTVVREPLRCCWNRPFEQAAPVREFPSFRGQRNWPGLWWFARTGEHVGFESWVERDRLMAFAATARFCAQVGWDYLRVGELGPVWAANLRWLAGYRHPRNAQPARMARLREVFIAPTALLAGADAAGERAGTLPVLFGMLWRRELSAELQAGRLGPATLVGLPSSAGRVGDARPGFGSAG